jgi:hypothetical protein
MKAEAGRESQVRKILDIIPRRGQKAFDFFHQILVDTKTCHHVITEVLLQVALNTINLNLNLQIQKCLPGKDNEFSATDEDTRCCDDDLL